MREDWASHKSERSVEIPKFFELINEYSPKTMLDVGFAGGFYHEDITDLGIKYTGMDADPTRIGGQAMKVDEEKKQKWRKSLNRIEVLGMDILDWKSKRQFDMVASISVIEHIIPCGYGRKNRGPKADLMAVDKMKDHVKPSGHLILSFPTGIDTTGKELKPDDLAVINGIKYDNIINNDATFILLDEFFWTETSLGVWTLCNKDTALNFEYTDMGHAKTLAVICLHKMHK